MPQEIAEILAGNIVRLGYDDLPRDVRDVTKSVILDTLGAMLAASSMGQGCKEIAGLVLKAGGRPESTVLGYGEKVPSWMAAFANGAMSHALDYDDQLHEGPFHASMTDIPAALAAAEAVSKVSGKEFLTAVALANELICRLGLCLSRRPGGWVIDWSATAVFGRFSATAAAGKLLELSESQMANAFGIAFSQAAGTFQIAASTGAIRGVHGAFPNMAGVLSALMAKEGITGCSETFEGKNGLFNAYFNGRYDRATLMDDWGKRFETVNLSFKPWPCCRFSHPYVDAALQLKNSGIGPQDIESVTLLVGDVTQRLCEPMDRRRRPQGASESKFSLPYIVSSSLVRGSPVIEHFTPDGINDAATLKMADRVKFQFDKDFNPPAGTPPGAVEIVTRDGKRRSVRVDVPYGHPDKPLSVEDLHNKFRDCFRYAAKLPPEENTEKVIDMVGNLEDVADVSQIIDLLIPVS
ncbi:MAG: MmgE/PrpD family protein [Chloroflexi bacterium]|nr:MmgE/PrpD family protein [Chloroflexota bacterium]